MNRRPKTPEELLADLKIFEAAWKREMAQVMRNAVERMVAGGSGRRIPVRYKVKLPRFTRTVREPFLAADVVPGTPGPASKRVRALRSPGMRKKAGGQHLEKAGRLAENRELRRSLDNALDRLRAFRDGRPMPKRYEMKFPEISGDMANEQIQEFLDSARSARDTLVKTGAVLTRANRLLLGFR